MNPSRRVAIVAGLLFILATVAALVAALLAPVLTGSELLDKVAGDQSAVAAGALLYLVAAFASVGIAVALYPVIRELNAGLAVGSVVFRTLEAAMYIAAAVSLLSVMTLGPQLGSAGAADRSSSLVAAELLVSLRDHATLMGVFAFSLGAGLYYVALFGSRLIPRWLSGWGIAGVALMAAACVLSLFSDQPVTGYVALILPIAAQEMVLALWLIGRGFGRSPSRAAAHVPAELPA
jgi:Domain of unknown function (DUF4386)